VTEVRVAALYTVALVPAGGLALVLSGWVMDLSKHQAPELPSGVDGWALNIVPAFATGLLVFLALAHFLGGTHGAGHSVGRHVRRCAPLYLVALGLGALLLHDARSPDFWHFGQLVLWVWLAALAGIMADGLTVLRRR